MDHFNKSVIENNKDSSKKSLNSCIWRRNTQPKLFSHQNIIITSSPKKPVETVLDRYFNASHPIKICEFPENFDTNSPKIIKKPLGKICYLRKPKITLKTRVLTHHSKRNQTQNFINPAKFIIETLETKNTNQTPRNYRNILTAHRKRFSLHNESNKQNSIGDIENLSLTGSKFFVTPRARNGDNLLNSFKNCHSPDKVTRNKTIYETLSSVRALENYRKKFDTIDQKNEKSSKVSIVNFSKTIDSNNRELNSLENVIKLTKTKKNFANEIVRKNKINPRRIAVEFNMMNNIRKLNKTLKK